MDSMKVNQERIMSRIEDFARFNDTPDAGVTRFSYSKKDAESRAYLLNLCGQMGLPMRTDAFGNIRIRYEGKEQALAPLMIGSHIDTVRNGGKYDGIVGVVGALETISVMHEKQYHPRRSIEVVVFAEEEGSNFGTTMVGSKGIVGKYTLEQLEQLKAGNGRNCLQLMQDFGLSPEQFQESILNKGDIYAMVELHIEQGSVLESSGLHLGIVEAIAGMHTICITLEGVSNHAGTTPMHLRNDPMTAGARLITSIRDMAVHQVLPTTVATVGRISCSPNMPNVIPHQVAFTVDIRDIEQSAIDKMLELIEKEAARVSAEEGVRISTEIIGKSPCVRLSPRIVQVIQEAAASLSDSCRLMNSGAVHDSAMLAEITDVGMIFIPSHEGKSHTREEYSSDEDIALGCSVLLQTALKLSE